MIEILKTDLSPLNELEIPGLEAGQDSGVASFALRADADHQDVLLIIQVESPLQPGTFVSSGFPPQDELWARIRIVGQDASGAPAQQAMVTAWQPIGANVALLIPALLGGGIRFGEIRMHPPSTAAPATWRWSLGVIVREHSLPVPPAVTLSRRGILCHVGDRTHSGAVAGCGVTVSAPPDAEVHVAAGFWLAAGTYKGKVASSHLLDQLDVAASALAAGQSYWACLSLGLAGVQVTKGAKAVTPAKPAPPAGAARLLWVRVRYRAGGLSLIESTDLEGDVVRDRYFAEPGTGLELRVHAGQALGGATWRFHSGLQTVALADGATNRIWQTAAGELAVSGTALPPEPTALGPWWEVDTAGGVVAALRDRRTYADDAPVIVLQGSLPGSPGAIASALIVEDLVVERIVYRLSGNGGGSAGATVLDATVNGVTVYTSQAADDHRPSWAFDSANLVNDAGVHELTRLHRGDVAALVSAEHPTGGTPEVAEAYFLCRRVN